MTSCFNEHVRLQDSQPSSVVETSGSSESSLLFSSLLVEPTEELGSAASDDSAAHLNGASLDFCIPRRRALKVFKDAEAQNALATLRAAQITPTEFLIWLISGNSNDLATFRSSFYSVTNKTHLEELFNTIWVDEKGRETFKAWMKPHALDLVCDDIHQEMECAKPSLFMNVEEVTPDFISTWDIHAIMGPISKITPSWSAVLKAATEKKDQKDEKSRNRPTTRELIDSQVHFLRSYRSCKVQLGLGLMAWSMGASRQLLNVLYQAGLCSSFTSIGKVIESLANHSIDQAKLISSGPHALAYDNINLSSSIFVEQTPSSMSKVQSGTFAVIFELVNVC